MKLISMLLHPGVGDANQVLIEDGAIRLSRARALSATAHLTDALRAQGIRPGQRVLALIDHDVRGMLFLAAASAMGLRVLMPYNLAQAAQAEWVDIARRARPDAAVVLRRAGAPVDAIRALGTPVAELPWLDEALHDTGPMRALQISALDPVPGFLVLFSSGTTGAPKAISVGEALVARRVLSVTRRLKFDATSRIFVTGLMNNTTGVIFSFGAMAHDAQLVFPRTRAIETWPEQVAADRVTHLMLRPQALHRFVEVARAVRADLSSLRVAAYGAAAMPRALLAEARELMPCEWVQGYGLSETFGPFCWLDEDDHRAGRHLREAYCVGRPDDTLEITLLPVEGHAAGVGEVAIRGDMLMDGYLNVSTGEIQAPEGWWRTGDLGVLDDDGQLLLKGRADLTVMSANGHRIYTEEVEAVLTGIAGVRDAVLLALPGPETLVVRPVACLQGALAEQDRERVRAVVRQALASALSPEKWPDWLWLSREPFPKSANDKVVRPEVARRVEADELIAL